MSMVAQVAHTPPVIDLGRAASVLHLFFCANVACRTYGGVDGCRAMIPQCQEIGNGVTRQPAHKESGQSINGELWIVAWDRHEDAVTREQALLFYDDRSHLNLPDEIAQPFGFEGAILERDHADNSERKMQISQSQPAAAPFFDVTN
jgi:hypothetical protein